MELLYKYLNGNVTVSIYDDGTKIQEWDDNEIPDPEFPNSMDVKITNYCDLGCPFCHEMSTVKGEHADLVSLFNVLSRLPAGTELALGGGNPLDHPDLEAFLGVCKKVGLICNMTINIRHIEENAYFLNQLINNKLIYGVGVSIDDNSDLRIIDKIINKANVVYHVIAGVSSINILDEIRRSSVKKVLILGYKDVGRGITFHDTDVEYCMEEWYEEIGRYIGKIHLSFDNLAIKQLKVKRFLTQEQWNSIYMGTDGQFTMYVDAVKKEFAISSTSPVRYLLTPFIENCFDIVKKSSKN